MFCYEAASFKAREFSFKGSGSRREWVIGLWLLLSEPLLLREQWLDLQSEGEMVVAA